MVDRRRAEQLEVGVAYQPAAVGPYLWHEYDGATVARDLGSIAARRLSVVTVGLSWDAFMPTDRRPSPRRLRDLEHLLSTARELGLGVVLSLFIQSWGDCVLLPAYAVDRRAPRAGVRCVSDARVVDGGPRDVYVDPLMLEVQVRWLDALLAAFTQHPAIVAWDLGNDPARTVRPRRIADLAAWAATLGERVRAQDEECRLSLGQDDVVRARGVRLGAVAPHVDALGLVLRPQLLPLPGDCLDPSRAVFVTDLARALAGPATPLLLDVGLASGDVVAGDAEAVVDPVTAEPMAARRAADQLLLRLCGSGAAGVRAAAWSDWGQRLGGAPPADRNPWLARLGIVDSTGVSKPVADAWEGLVAVERAVVGGSPFPAAIDVDSYYANLPDSMLDLYGSWQGDRGDMPAILG